MEVKCYFGTISLNIHNSNEGRRSALKCQHTCCFQGSILKSGYWKRCSACFQWAEMPPGSAKAVFTKKLHGRSCWRLFGSYWQLQGFYLRWRSGLTLCKATQKDKAHGLHQAWFSRDVLCYREGKANLHLMLLLNSVLLLYVSFWGWFGWWGFFWAFFLFGLFCS